jgi:hypothetical protein
VLVISTSTVGGVPDQDGYLLTVDELDSVSLNATGTAELRLESGLHRLRLSGIADHCSVTPGEFVEVDVARERTTSFAFVVNCPDGTIRITTATTGLDLDSDGYQVEVDGAEGEAIHPNGEILIWIKLGSRMVTLTGLAPNCSTEGPASRSVTVADSELVSIEFAVVCSATSGVIAVSVQASKYNPAWVLNAVLDGAELLLVGQGGPYYFNGVPAGEHDVALLGAPENCLLDPMAQLVTVTAGTLMRDTVAAEFSLTCPRPPPVLGTVRITAPTTGPIPSSTQYTVWYESYGYWDYGGTSVLLGTLMPNDSLLANLPASTGVPYWYDFRLKDVPPNCRVRPPYRFHDLIMPRDTLDIEFVVTC